MYTLPAPSTRIHLIGIGGIGVSGVAFALLARGYRVSGSDVRESQLTTWLRERGATVHIGHSASHLDDVDLVVVSTAIPPGNPELVAATERKLELRHRSELLGALLAEHEVAIGVIGTHGKGTTSSAITHILDHAASSSARPGPSFIIGGLLENFGKTNSRLTGSETIIAEVDESDGSLKNVFPTLAVVNNLEADHLNYYENLEHVQRTVIEALQNNPRLKRVFINADDPGAAAIIPKLTVPVTTFGRTSDADVRALDASADFVSGRFTLSSGGARTSVTLPLPGLHNLDNSVAASSVALHLGVSPDLVASALSTFKGLENRFTVVHAASRVIVKDYISHPTGIRRVLEAAKTSGRKTTAVFKPYRFTMVNYLQDDYAEAFHDADHTIITDLYPAGEVPIPGIDTEFLCNKIRARGPLVTHVPHMEDIVATLHGLIGPDEQVVFFGGDDLFRLADRFAAELVAKGSEVAS
ncbi:MAG TPA: UDP-N-acetylmuramate--L-alanine ligase [Myxococcota bacterium]|nr:UDP-N-acetylmuramate--L-alanine ligase [Myxococcota bacterium]